MRLSAALQYTKIEMKGKPRMHDINQPEGDSDFINEILNTVETLIVLLDIDGRILRFNHACEALTKFSEKEAVGQKVWDFLIIEEEIDAVRNVFTTTHSQSVPTHFTNYWKTKNGERRLLRWSNKMLRRSDGELLGVLATGVDITETIATEHDLSYTQAFLRSIIDASPVSVVTIDERGIILSFSKVAEETFGYSSSEILGQNVKILMPDPDRSRHDGYLKHYRDTGEKRIIGRARPIIALRKNGEKFPAMLYVSEFCKDDRVFVGFVEDVSEQEATKRHLSDTQLQLQHAGRVGAMGEIATSIAHELNQPLTAAASLIGAVSLRLKKTGSDDADIFIPLLNDAVAEIRRASDIIQQMREFVRKRKTAKSLHNLNKIIEDAGALASIGADADGIEIRWDMAENIGEIPLDRIQIQQVITNLVRNAIDALKGAPKRIITITSRRNNDFMEVSVADTGPGLHETVQDRLFDPFVSSKDDGLGVGLSISKSIIDAHQGKIFAINQESGGCVFTFTLPTGTDGD